MNLMDLSFNDNNSKFHEQSRGSKNGNNEVIKFFLSLYFSPQMQLIDANRLWANFFDIARLCSTRYKQADLIMIRLKMLKVEANWQDDGCYGCHSQLETKNVSLSHKGRRTYLVLLR